MKGNQMLPFQLISLVFAFVCFVLSTWNTTDPNWRRLLGAGLAFVTVYYMLGFAR
ncbi:MAG TPA: hypothetical protein VNX68_04765 [Nitrosopumilaceae archaeon]|nr:hypothetical protein [Nitrosopumilaceae archaeon]